MFRRDTLPPDAVVNAKFNFACLPTVFLLASHLKAEELHAIEDVLIGLHAKLTYSVHEARLILGKVSTAKRARLELQWLGLSIQERSSGYERDRKRRKRRSSSTTTSSDVGNGRYPPTNASTIDRPCVPATLIDNANPESRDAAGQEEARSQLSPHDQVIVVKLEWLERSLTTGELLSLDPFVILRGRPKEGATAAPKSHGSEDEPLASADAVKGGVVTQDRSHRESTLIDRARREAHVQASRRAKTGRGKRPVETAIIGRAFASTTQQNHRRRAFHGGDDPPPFLPETTSEHEGSDAPDLPPLPAWVEQKQLYSCQRRTPAEQPNELFLRRLDQIRVARILTLDEIGVRAYSTSIAAIAAYPYKLQSPREILGLPGCDQKIAYLFQEYQANDGRMQAVVDLEADPVMKALLEFYHIWGVGATTARDFYFNKGWRELDDLIEFGWTKLNRVQQIGLKYYDEFQLKIPRAEVELIASKITEHARRVTGPGVQTVIVGGYRRGKEESGDVDVILSHPNQDVTLDLVSRIVKSLEKEGWVTHTLTLNLTNSKRNQEPLPVRTPGTRSSGFDTLDKALVVWQRPSWVEGDIVIKGKNENPHRRVDIIISPWRTVGCAVAGWTSGTTFQRDLRRYAKKVKGWKFDSSGVRDRASGVWIDLEHWTDPTTRCKTWQEAEQRVFEGLGLEYREPWERCTW